MLFDVVVVGFLVPFSVALVLVLGCWKVESFRSASASVALIGASVTGVLLLSWLPVVPDKHWQWLPTLASIGCLLTVIAGNRARYIRLAVVVVLALVASYTLVPNWKRLEETIWGYRIAGVFVLIVYSLFTEFGTSRSDGRLASLILAITAIATSILMFCSGSLKFAQIGGLIAAASLAWAAVLWSTQSRNFNLAGAMPAYSVGIVGLLFCGYMNSYSDLPIPCYCLVAAAPLGLALSVSRKSTPTSSDCDQASKTNGLEIDGVPPNKGIGPTGLLYLLPTAIGLGWAIVLTVLAEFQG